MSLKDQTIVFVRHAHRHKPHPDEDNGISDKGREQVKELVRAFEKGALPKSRRFWTSPKLRCVETLEPLAEISGAGCEVENLLDEQHHAETQSDFIKRIHRLIEKVAAANETVYLCSHGDVIPVAIDELTGKQVDVSKGQAIVVIARKGRWELE